MKTSTKQSKNVCTSVDFMGFDHAAQAQLEQKPAFFDLKLGDTVIVWDHSRRGATIPRMRAWNWWWMGQVISLECSASDPKLPTLAQLADVDTGVIRWVNANCVQEVLMPITN